ncbi:MAG TPA: hypothetical protein VN256_05365 [Pyrinomonadaceae bacterium]|nr:hypothetical protein [Pyrinomonadaceae bacterium]
MKADDELERLARPYLLGLLAAGEQNRFEEGLLTNDALFEELLIAEDELIDDYLLRNLSGSEHDRFEQHFLSTPERRQKLSFAVGLNKYVTAGGENPRPSPAVIPPPQRVSFWQRLRNFITSLRPLTAISVAATLLLTFISVALLLRVRRLQNELNQLNARQASLPQVPDSPTAEEAKRQLAEQTARAEQLSAELQLAREQKERAERELAQLKEKDRPPEITGPTPQPPTRVFTASVLTMGGVRSGGAGGMQTVAIPQDAGSVVLPLELLTNKYRSYRATLMTDAGQPVQTSSGLKPSKVGGVGVVLFRVAAARLRSRSEYQLQLSGVTSDRRAEEIGLYYFRIQSQ